jgi:hypothetical protein
MADRNGGPCVSLERGSIVPVLIYSLVIIVFIGIHALKSSGLLTFYQEKV